MDKYWHFRQDYARINPITRAMTDRSSDNHLETLLVPKEGFFIPSQTKITIQKQGVSLLQGYSLQTREAD